MSHSSVFGTVLSLLLSGCTPKWGDTTPVIDAARAGDVATLEKLFAGGADPNQVAGVNDWPPLMHAIHKGQKKSVRVLLKHGANVNFQTAHWSTPLIMAAGYGYSDIVAMLLDAGARPDIRDHDGYTALNAAVGGTADIDRFTVGHCQTETVRVLLDKAPRLRLEDRFTDSAAVRIAKLAGCTEVLKMVNAAR
jgi:hypothetical protein